MFSVTVQIIALDSLNLIMYSAPMAAKWYMTASAYSYKIIKTREEYSPPSYQVPGANRREKGGFKNNSLQYNTHFGW